MFQCSVEITSVARNGNWVTTIAKTSAGSSGARRRQRPCDDAAGRTVLSGSAGGASVVMLPSALPGGRALPRGRLRCERRRGAVQDAAPPPDAALLGLVLVTRGL